MTPIETGCLCGAARIRIDGDPVVLPRCGTRLFGRVPGTDLTGVVAARLPEGAFRPEYHIHCRHALAPVRDGLVHYRALPPAFGGDGARVDW